MSQFTRFFSGKFQNLWNCAGVKILTNIMSAWNNNQIWKYTNKMKNTHYLNYKNTPKNKQIQ